MSYNLCTSGAILAKAGIGYNSAVSGALLASFCDEAEGVIKVLTNHDWVTTPCNTQFSGAISDAVSTYAAMQVIAYDSSNYRSRLEFQTKLDLLTNNFLRLIKELSDDNKKAKMGV